MVADTDDGVLRGRDFFRKLVRGGQHIEELRRVLSTYQDSHPYEMRKTAARKKQVWRMRITEQPPIETALVVGDALYNLRASLDYLAGELCTLRSDAGSAYFPFKPIRDRIWELPEVEAEDEERRSLRKHWRFFERAMPDEVIALLKGLEIPQGLPKKGEPIDEFVLLNSLSNRDRHTRLHLVATGLDASTTFAKAVGADGATLVYGPSEDGRILYEDGAVVPLPAGVTKVEIHGTVKVVVLIPLNGQYAPIPEALDQITQYVIWVASQFTGYLRE
jgi:hypothetical protein